MDFYWRPVIHRVPDFLDGNIADGDAAICPVGEKTHGILAAEGARHSVNEDIATSIATLRANAVGGIRIGDVKRTMIFCLAQATVDYIDALGRPTVALQQLGALGVASQRDRISADHYALRHQVEFALCLPDDNAVGLGQFVGRERRRRRSATNQREERGGEEGAER